tara:strand:+ start:470 stop:1054 length:585 start_codon:yes stop_codon:yes gene_type:complete
MNLYNFIKVYNTIPKKVCVNLLKKFKKVNYRRHQWQNNGIVIGSRKEEELKNYDLEKKEQDILVPFVKEALNKYRDEIYQENPLINYSNDKNDPFKMVESVSPFRLNRYDEQSNMAVHVDHIYTIFDGQEKGIPILSVVGILNQNYEGGDFKIIDKYLKFKTGDILIFPSNFMYPHEVTSITKGTRYSFVTWGY